MDNHILFSIVIPTYNREHLIVKTINSVLNQSYNNFEIIIVDDGSTDNTEEVVRAITDKRLTYYKKENEERSIARNFGLNKAKGDYVYLLDSDDIIYSHHLETAFDYINQSNKIDVFFLPYEILDIKTGKVKSLKKINNTINDELINGNFLSCHGVFLSKVVARKFKFKEDLVRGEDYEFWLQIASEYEIKYHNIVTSALIIHNERSVNDTDIHFLIDQKNKFLNFIKNNSSIVKKYGNHFNKIFSHTYSYIALHAALAKDKKNGFVYYIKSLQKKPFSFFSRKKYGYSKALIYSVIIY